MKGSWLEVRIKEGKDLTPQSIDGKSDPYVVIEFGGIWEETRVEMNTLTPKWNEKYSFEVNDPEIILRLTVKDKDKFTEDEVLGECRMRLH